MAFDSVEPIGDEYRQTAELRLGLMQLLSVNYAANGVKVDMPTDWRDLMPERYVYESEKSTPTVVRAQEEENQQKAEVKRVGAILGFKM